MLSNMIKYLLILLIPLIIINYNKEGNTSGQAGMKSRAAKLDCGAFHFHILIDSKFNFQNLMNFRHLQSNRVRTTRIQFLSSLPFSFLSSSLYWPSFLCQRRPNCSILTERSSADFLCPHCQLFNAKKRETVR